MAGKPWLPPPGEPDPWEHDCAALYHITHIENLESIGDVGALLCDRDCDEIRTQSIAYPGLKQKRRRIAVEVAAGGVLSDYVPFHFAPRSPMLYAIHTGYVQDCRDQREIAHLVVPMDQVAVPGKFAITDRHPRLELASHYGSTQGLETVDWEVMRATYWRSTDDDPERKDLRMAECLIWESVPFWAVVQIGVCTTEAAEQTRHAVAGAGHQPKVAIRPSWYY